MKRFALVLICAATVALALPRKMTEVGEHLQGRWSAGTASRSPGHG